MKLKRFLFTAILSMCLVGSVFAAETKAKRIRTETGNLDGILSAADDNVQKALETVDDVDTDVIPEGMSNLYYTSARFDTDFSSKSTTDLSEGANLYYTNARARASISEIVTGLDYNNITGVLSLTTGYVVPTTIQETNWDNAFGWGDHAGLYLRFTNESTNVTGGTFDLTTIGDVDAANLPYALDAIVHVHRGATDIASAVNLAAAYVKACGLTPGDAALSRTNRACVIIPSGGYDIVSTTLVLNTQFVDLVATEPQRGGLPLATDIDYPDGTTSLTQFRPPPTVVYSTTNGATVIEQSVQDIRLIGFGIGQLSGDGSGTYHAFYCSTDDNADSFYDKMYFWHKAPYSLFVQYRSSVGFAKHVKGTWRDCIGNRFAWRMGTDGEFSAQMFDCYAGGHSYMGDLGEAVGCLMVRCKAIGTKVASIDSGYGSFGGCSSFAVPIDSDCVFVECEAGSNSFGLGKKNEGTFIRCRGGDYCFGATTAPTMWPGEFAGYAEDCIAGKGSFGGCKTGVTNYGKCTGTLIRCTSEGSELPTRLEGATIRNSRLTNTTNNQDGVILLDDNSEITDTTILVVEGGTGIPINDDGNARNVIAVGCQVNNYAVDSDGLGPNVTNLVTPYLDIFGNVSVANLKAAGTVRADGGLKTGATYILTVDETESLTNYLTSARADTWLGTKDTGDLSEGTNLYYTAARARAAISETVTGLSYDSGTGVLSLTANYVIPTTTQETNWDTHLGSDGSSHTFINQDVTSGSTPTFTATNITGVPAASVLAGTFGTGAYVFDNTVSGITDLTCSGNAIANSFRAGYEQTISASEQTITQTGQTTVALTLGGSFVLYEVGATNPVFSDGTQIGQVMVVKVTTFGDLTTLVIKDDSANGKVRLDGDKRFDDIEDVLIVMWDGSLWQEVYRNKGYGNDFSGTDSGWGLSNAFSGGQSGWGNSNEFSGANAGWGSSNEFSGYNAGWGGGNVFSGSYAAGWGWGNVATAFQTVFGRFSTDQGHLTNWVATDDLFKIGIGTGVGARADAFRLLKNGESHWETDSKHYYGLGNDVSRQFDGSDWIFNSENITANDEVHFTNFDLYSFDNDITTPGSITDGTTIHTPSTTTSITAAGGITVTNTIMRIAGDGGAIDITADPQIADGTDGQIVILQGDHDTNTVKLDDGTGLQLAGAISFTMGQGDTMMLTYDSGDDDWKEISRADN